MTRPGGGPPTVTATPARPSTLDVILARRQSDAPRSWIPLSSATRTAAGPPVLLQAWCGEPQAR
jgi:hypothetical protein